MWSARDWLFKVLFPLLLFAIIIYGIVNHIGPMDAEIPINNQQDVCQPPSPATQ